MNIPFVFQAAAVLCACLVAHVLICTLRGSTARTPCRNLKYFGYLPFVFIFCMISCGTVQANSLTLINPDEPGAPPPSSQPIQIKTHSSSSTSSQMQQQTAQLFKEIKYKYFNHYPELHLFKIPVKS